MAKQPEEISYQANPDASPDERIADALEFMAQRFAGIEQCLTVIRDDIRMIASRPPMPTSPR